MWRLGLSCGLLIAGRAGAAEIESPPDQPIDYEEPATWMIGTMAPADVVALIPFSSVDPAALSGARDEAAAEVTPILRHVPAMADEALAGFDGWWTDSRHDFETAVGEAFGPLPLDARTFLGEDFESFRLQWIGEHPERLAPSPALGRAWAMALDDTALVRPWRDALRTAMNEGRIVDPEETPETSRFYRLVTTTGPDEPLSSANVARRAIVIDAGKIATVAAARSRFIQQHATDGREMAGMVGRLLRPNVFPDAALTAHERESRSLQAVAPARDYRAGTVVVRQGDVVDHRVHTALVDLRDKIATLPPSPAIDPFDPVVATPPTQVEPPLPGMEPALGAVYPVWMNRVFLIGVPVSLIAEAVALAWLASRLSKRSSMLVTTNDEASQPDSPVVRALRDSTVQHLYSHRQVLLDDQDRSADQVSALEARLARLHPQIEARILAYETRIKELEAMLATKSGTADSEFEQEIASLRREREIHVARSRPRDAG